MQFRKAGLSQVGQGSAPVAEFFCYPLTNPAMKIIPSVPAEPFDQALRVSQYTPVVIQKIIEIQIIQQRAGFAVTEPKGEQTGVNGASRGTARPDNIPKYAASAQCLQRASIGDTFHTAAFEHQVAKMVGHGFSL